MANQVLEDVERIIKYPIRSNIKISNKDVRTLREQIPRMSTTELRSLREFLTVVPAISKKRIEVGFNEHKKFGAFTIVRDTPHAKILEEKYSPNDKDDEKLTLKANIKN